VKQYLPELNPCQDVVVKLYQNYWMKKSFSHNEGVQKQIHTQTDTQIQIHRYICYIYSLYRPIDTDPQIHTHRSYPQMHIRTITIHRCIHACTRTNGGTLQKTTRALRNIKFFIITTFCITVSFKIDMTLVSVCGHKNIVQ